MASKSARPSPSRASRAGAPPSLRPVPPAGRRGGDLAGVGLLTLGVLLAAGLRATDAGPLVGWLAAKLSLSIGELAEAVPFVVFYAGARRLLRRPGAAPTAGLLPALAVLAPVAAGWLHLVVPAGQEFAWSDNHLGWMHPPQLYGGLLGAGVVYGLRHVVGQFGCPLVLAMAALLGVLLLSERGLGELLDEAAGALRQRRLRRLEKRAKSAALKAIAPPAPPTRTARRRTPANRLVVADLTFPAGAEPDSFLPPAPQARPAPPEPAAEPPAAPELQPETLDPRRSKYLWPEFNALQRDPVPVIEDGPLTQLVLPGMAGKMAKRGQATKAEEFPPVQLGLVQPPPAPPLPDRTPEIRANSRRLEATLASFRIDARVVNTEVGPTVTRYEMELAPGIRVSRVAVLSDDIAMALASIGIRIEAPVPGKGVIGIEVPNQTRETVDLHALLCSDEFQKAKGPLPFVVGKDIAGHIRIGELSRMPHVLVAGTTNSGKSVCLNCIIISLIYRLSPRDLRFLMIDPKRVELTLYDGIPHLDRPVVTDAGDAADLLRGAVREMTARYDRLREQGARNIGTYNERVGEEDRMPYLVVIIDELAELMMMARAEVEDSICRIAQLARAVGIHLIVATQRPAVNVVTGQIKTNIGTRVAFRVPQQVDSRVILDQIGAERLIGSGDMLYSPADAGGKPERLQGAFVGEDQVHKLVHYLRSLPSTLTAQYAQSIIQPVTADDDPSADETAVAEDELDELFWDCVQLVRSEGEGSTSRLQRTFGIGYNRAGRIMDQMFAVGVVGPPRGSKPREVLAGGPQPPAARGRAAAAAAPEEDEGEL
jgi:S-DNA-T family DNA segregation ATPase FtsK/SpoIIIE